MISPNLPKLASELNSDASCLTSQESPSCPVGSECILPVDLVLQSSDGKLIGAHRTNMEHFSDGFPTCDSVTSTSEPVPLTEDGETLTLLLRFMHKHKYPGLTPMDAASIFALAEAAEKYMVYSAMASSHAYIEHNCKEHPVLSLCYAVKFDYPAIADAVSSLTLLVSLEEIQRLSISNHRLVYAWFRYREVYLSVATSILDRYATGARVKEHDCPFWDRYLKGTAAKIPPTSTETLKSIADEGIEKILDDEYVQILKSCDTCRDRETGWRAHTRKRILQAPKFSELL
ncbi:hypothetical protein DFP72DRAFT_1175867 [Ephemerocybe angulata]|uniref:BTB domain-containing protein n=1 Tax=Ephemerocybe angulata TaxID=980116 RepID=A0A8H6HGA5_9AGAR|nr:hypothetical protein DFP72DRAFT_1175867 [Tulosesus angulatus]